jgi:hypothetical protein
MEISEIKLSNMLRRAFMDGKESAICDELLSKKKLSFQVWLKCNYPEIYVFSFKDFGITGYYKTKIFAERQPLIEIKHSEIINGEVHIISTNDVCYKLSEVELY